MPWRILVLLAVLVAAGTVATPQEKETSKERLAYEKKARKAIDKHAHFFALVKSIPSRKDIGTKPGTALGGTPGFGGGGPRGSGGGGNAETYGGFLTPKYRERLFVVACADPPEREKFTEVDVYFYNKPNKGYDAEYVGRDELSKILVFVLKKKTLGKAFAYPHEPLENLRLVAGEPVVSLGHPWVDAKKNWVFWQMSFGALDFPPLRTAPKHWPIFRLGPLLYHLCDLGKRAHYWHGGPVIRVVEGKRVEILGMNLNSFQSAHRALPYAKVREIRDQVIQAKSAAGM
ncbi:MAG: hypothetical protein ACYTEZ_14100 [Planctomycetota bacterium]|jgi:hypothetical protein